MQHRCNSRKEAVELFIAGVGKRAMQLDLVTCKQFPPRKLSAVFVPLKLGQGPKQFRLTVSSPQVQDVSPCVSRG